MVRRAALLGLLAALLVAGTAGLSGTTPAPSAAARAFYVVTLKGTLAARTASSVGKEAAGFSLDVKRRAVSYRWTERLTETIPAGTGAAASRSDRLTGSGRATIYFHMRHVNFKDIEVGCAMKLTPVRQVVTGADRLAIRAAAGRATASGLLPVDLIRSTYSGPASIGGFGTPCFEGRPFDWAGLVGIPVRGKPQAAPFGPLSCELGRVGSSCSRPFSFSRTWPIANGSSSLRVHAVLTARRLAGPPSR